jgi:hypothetical protein
VAGSSTLQNEPPGFITLVDRPFLTDHPDYGFGANPQFANPADLHLAEGWATDEGSSPNMQAVDFTSLQGDDRVFEARYPPLMRSGVGPGTAFYVLPAGIPEIYLEYWIHISTNWIANNSSTNKTCFFGLNQGNNQLILSTHGRNCGKMNLRLLFQGIQEINIRPQFDPSFNIQNREIKRGVWTKIGMRVKMHSTPQIGATPASGDGEIDIWVDGQVAGTYRNMHLAQIANPTRTPAFSQINLNPTYGGGGEGIPRNYVNDFAGTVFTYSRDYVYTQSLLPANQRSNLSGQEQGYPTPAPEFAIDDADEAQYFRYDRFYISRAP